MRVAYVTSDDVRLNVEIDGADDAPTVVLVHGLAASVALGWRAPGVLDRLGAAGLRTVAYDARGHGHSDKLHEPDHYGDARLMLDLAEIVQGFAGPDAVVAGYSMGAATVLLALSVGLDVRAAALGATPYAVLRWTDADEQQSASAIAVLEGRAVPDAEMMLWIDFLDAIRADKAALAACLRGLRPVVAGWERITGPAVVAVGATDASAAPASELTARIPGAVALELAGDHYSAVSDPAFTDAIATLARG
jgi:pimeloyl-ACP methyl ester carboxylesterase